MKSLRVLIIDDSFTMRLLITDLLQSDPVITVIAAISTGEEALRRLPELQPDCIVLDLAMPGMDGLTTLKNIMAKYPTPVIILSAYSKEDADITFKCLTHGAVSFVAKPSGEVSFDIDRIKEELINKVKTVVSVQSAHLFKNSIQNETLSKTFWNKPNKIIVMGASTGGPQTLESILTSMPADFPVPILIAQHMPNNLFLQSFVDRLNQNCWIEAKIADDKEMLQPGKIYCVPTGFNTSLMNVDKEVYFRLEKVKSSWINYPSINEVMIAASNAYQHRSIGIILSGMGTDGVEGMKEIKAKGGTTIVQDETALLFGMPKAVIDAGVADKILPLKNIPKVIEDLLIQ